MGYSRSSGEEDQESELSIYLFLSKSKNWFGNPEFFYIFVDLRQELEMEKKLEEEAKRKAKSKSLLGFLQNNITEDDEEGSLELSFAGLFKCMFCTHQKPINEREQILRIASSLDAMNRKMENIERYQNC